MSYSRVTRTPNGVQAILYAYGGMDEKGHNDNEKRNQVISGVDLIPKMNVIDQFQSVWKKGRVNTKYQVVRIIQSFTKNEFDPDNPEDVERCNQCGQEFVKRYYPGHQALVFTQTDGKGGYCHNHILVNFCATKDGKGLTKNQYFYMYVRKWSDDVVKDFTIIDYGQGAEADKTTQTERTKRERGKYVWKDDLKERISLAMDECDSEEDFFDKCKAHGVGVDKHTRKKDGYIYYTYTLEDLSKQPADFKVSGNRDSGLKARSNRLGDDYGYEALEKHLKNNAHYNKNNKADVSESVVKKEPVEVKPREREPFESYGDAVFDYAVGNRDDRPYFDFDRFEGSMYIEHLDSKMRENQIEIDQITGMLEVMQFLNHEQKRGMKVILSQLFDLIDEQRRILKEKQEEEQRRENERMMMELQMLNERMRQERKQKEEEEKARLEEEYKKYIEQQSEVSSDDSNAKKEDEKLYNRIMQNIGAMPDEDEFDEVDDSYEL